MSDWKNDKNLGSWPFIQQRNKWGYLNNPRWRPVPRPFVPGGPDDYDGRESQEPQIYTPEHQPPYPSAGSKIHRQCGHWHRPVGPQPPPATIPPTTLPPTTLPPTTIAPTSPPPAGNIKAEIPLEMCSTWLFADWDVNQLWLCTELEIDPADYDGVVSTRFEAVIDNTFGSENRSLFLVDADMNIYAELVAVHGTVPSLTNQWDTRYSANFILNPAKTKYYCYTPVDPDFALNFRTARIILDVENPTKGRFQISPLEGDASSGGGAGDVDYNNQASYAIDTYSGSYGYMGDGTNDRWFGIFLKTEFNWDTVNYWTVDAIGSGDGKIALFNKTTNSMVAGTEILFSSVNPVRHTADFVNLAANFNDGHEFEFRIKTTGSGFFVHSARLYVKLDPLIAAEVWMKTGCVIDGSFGGVSYGGLDNRYDTSARYRFDSTKFTAGTPFYFESTAKETGTEASLFLHNCGDADYGRETYVSIASLATPAGPVLDDPVTYSVAPGYLGNTFWPEKAIKTQIGGDVRYALGGGGKLDYLLYAGTPGTTDALVYLGEDEGISVLTQSIDFSGFDFTGHISASLPVQHVEIMGFAWSFCRTPSVTPANLGSSVVRVTGTTHALTVNNVVLPAGDGVVNPPSPTGLAQAFDVTSEAGWSIAALNAAVVTIEFTHHDAVEQMFYMPWIALGAAVGIDVTNSQLDFSNAVRQRQRSPELSTYLDDDKRYITHVSATSSSHQINKHACSFIIALVRYFS